MSTNTKYKILDILKASPNEFISGEALSDSLELSRNSVWKAVKALRLEGYDIISRTNNGYCLLESMPDVFTEYELKELIKTKVIAKDIKFFKSINSTNDYAKSIALDKNSAQTVVVALEQTNGHGVNQTNFYSPKDDGIYISFILDLDIQINQINEVAEKMLLCAKNAIKKTCGIEIETVSPNGLYYKGKKLGGILTQMLVEPSSENQNGVIKYIVSGIGINVNNISFPKEVSDKLTSLRLCCDSCGNGNGGSEKIKRLQLTKNLINELDCILYENIE